MIRDFWSGLIRANTVVVGIAASSWSSSSASTSAPLSTPAQSTPISEHTLAATRPLSPVMIFTCDPEPFELGDGGAGVGLRPVGEGQEARPASAPARRRR